MSTAAVNDINALPFIGKRKKHEHGKHPRHFWRVKPNGDYGQECKIGIDYALKYLAYEEADRGGTILANIVSDMSRDLTGIEIGFLQMVAFAAADGVGRARRISAYWTDCEAKDKDQQNGLKGGEK